MQYSIQVCKVKYMSIREQILWKAVILTIQYRLSAKISRSQIEIGLIQHPVTQILYFIVRLLSIKIVIQKD